MAAALPVIAIASTAIGTGVSLMGAMQSSQAAQSQAAYQAQVARNNAVIADQNRAYSIQKGQADAATSDLKTAAMLGKQRVAAASNGFDVNSGSNADLEAGTADLGQQNSDVIRNNALRTAYGFQNQDASFTAQAGQQDAAAAAAGTTGGINAASSIIGGASALSTQYLKLYPPAVT